jgi:polyisoprenoid-binding protein YceI
MRLRHTFAALLFASSAAVGTALAADTYKIDPEHGTVIYRISHFNLGNAYGRFNKPTGTVVFDASDPSKSRFTFEVKTENVDTANAKRDQHLKSPDFFDAKQFPTITFPITKTGEGDTKVMGVRSGWEAQVNLKRSEFGMNTMQGPIGDDVHLIISFEAVKQ